MQQALETMRIPHRSSKPALPTTIMGGEGPSDLYGIRAATLIPGRGDPIPNGTLIISPTTNQILYAGSPHHIPARFKAVPITVYSDLTLLPGLWDVHTHFIGADVVGSLTDSMAQFLPGSQARVGAVLVDDLRRTLMAGFTSVRELGGTAGYLAPLIDRGVLVGPSVYSALSVLSITGGHGDQHDCPLGLVKGAADSGSGYGQPYALCDGVDECVRMVRTVVRNGAKVIKVCSTGGVMSLNDQPEDSQFSPAELEAIVGEAARSGRVVASHAIGKAGIMSALRAGVKSVEHGMYLDDEVVDLMLEKDAILVPTRHVVESLAGGAYGEIPPLQRAKLERMLQLSRNSLKLAVKRGVRIALGTDTWSSDRKNVLAHGKNANEFHWLKVAGLTSLQAIEAATATPPETLGRQGPKAGQLKEGFDADFILVKGDPLEDVDVLTKPDNITHVWKAAKLVKSP